MSHNADPLIQLEAEFEHTMTTLRNNWAVEDELYRQIRRDLRIIRRTAKTTRIAVATLVILTLVLSAVFLGSVITLVIRFL